MQYLPTRFHGLIDYLAAAVLVLGAGPLGYGGGGWQTWAPVTAALLIVSYSLLTDYEWGVIRRVPVPIHMAMDLLIGILLAASPWALGFQDEAWAPHLAVGAVLIAASLTTQPRAYGLEHPAFLRVHEPLS